jgi:hypothetical protein
MGVSRKWESMSGRKNDMQKKNVACGEFKSRLPIVFLISNLCKEGDGPTKFHQTYALGHQKMWFFLTYNNSKTHLQLHFIMFN